ncbi:KH domain-containing protein [Candidatus Nanohalovita haloferacivicina]|uniref:KH domain-containing protein n=1 Tax=Candidatus Nanohalovita haloferacivicina TaxID=2978046 RepID=UPI00325FA25E|nr:Ribosomal RNA assembly protein [Candidatus Nanohalobia archaeon BNXNv]
MKEVMVPEERVGVLIGSEGETKEELQDLTDCDVTIQDNQVALEGEPLDEMTAQKIVKAIGRGFNPEKAFKLVERDVTLHLMDIGRYANTKNAEERLKGRVIGREGEARTHIEKIAQVDISVYGTTIGIIGKAQNIEVAMEAINMLLNGSSHSTAYNYLEKNQDKIKR